MRTRPNLRREAARPTTRRLFFGRARCANCHIGASFTDESFHNTGVAVRSGDPGRGAVTGRADQRGAFRTPTLRDVTLTAPRVPLASAVVFSLFTEFLRLRFPYAYLLVLGALLIVLVLYLPGGLASLASRFRPTRDLRDAARG